MVLSVLEARVAPERWDDLKSAYDRRAGVLPPGIVESFLVQDVSDSAIWRIITVEAQRDVPEIPMWQPATLWLDLAVVMSWMIKPVLHFPRLG